MKIKGIAMVMASALLTVGLLPLASAQDDFGAAQEGIEVITVVGKRRAPPEGIEVITVVGKRPAPTVASICVDQVRADRATGKQPGSELLDAFNTQALDARRANMHSVRQAVKACIDRAQAATGQS